MDPVQDLQERIAHLSRAVDDLSEVVARQARELAALDRRVGLLLDREAERLTEGSVTLTDRPPPHW